MIAEADVDALLAEASRSGIVRFDTAPLYGFGLSEVRLGHHLRGLPREQFSISTKVGRYYLPAWGEPADRGNWHSPLARRVIVDYSRDGVMRSLEQSFSRLGVDRIDVVLVHDIDRRNQGDAFEARYHQAVDVALPLLGELKAAGHIDAFGLGISEVDVARDFLRDADIDVLMLAGRVSLLDHTDALEVLDLARERNTAVMAASVFNSGFLADIEGAGTFDYDRPSDAIRLRCRAIRDVVAQFGVPIQAAALQFPLRFAAVESIVVGMSRSGQVASNLGWADWPIPEEMWERLCERGLTATAGRPHPPARDAARSA